MSFDWFESWVLSYDEEWARNIKSITLLIYLIIYLVKTEKIHDV